jgi:hypothetical protein
MSLAARIPAATSRGISKKSTKASIFFQKFLLWKFISDLQLFQYDFENPYNFNPISKSGQHGVHYKLGG